MTTDDTRPVCLDCGKTPDAPGVPAICAGWHTRNRTTTDDTHPLSAKSLSNAYYSKNRTHGAHTHDGPLHEPCREYVMGECILATLDAERARHAALVAAAQAMLDRPTDIPLDPTKDASLVAVSRFHLDALSAALDGEPSDE